MELFIVDTLGWIGAFLLLLAYAAVSFKKLAADSLAYQGLNVAASVLLAINTIYHGAFPSSFVNIVWTFIAIFAILTMTRKYAKVQIRGIAEPKGHYSPAVVHNGLIFVSGQLPVNHATGEVETGAIEMQTELALRNVESILKAANSDLDHVLQMTIYISEMDDWGKVNEVYKQILGGHKPARAIVPVKDLHFGAKIEIQAIAAVKEEK